MFRPTTTTLAPQELGGADDLSLNFNTISLVFAT